MTRFMEIVKVILIVVEPTHNWYWLVAGLQEHGYKLHLANPSAVKQYEGLNIPMTKGTSHDQDSPRKRSKSTVLFRGPVVLFG